MIAFVKKLYYRYTLMTGIYMLGSGESFLLHIAGLFFFVVFVRYILLDFLADYLGIKLFPSLLKQI